MLVGRIAYPLQKFLDNEFDQWVTLEVPPPAPTAVEDEKNNKKVKRNRKAVAFVNYNYMHLQAQIMAL